MAQNKEEESSFCGPGTKIQTDTLTGRSPIRRPLAAGKDRKQDNERLVLAVSAELCVLMQKFLVTRRTGKELRGRRKRAPTFIGWPGVQVSPFHRSLGFQIYFTWSPKSTLVDNSSPQALLK